MTEDAVVAVVTRNLFYRRLHYYSLAVLLVALIVIAIMSSVLYYISGNYTHPIYFATDNVGRLIKIIPISEPNMSNDDVTQWAVDAVQSAYSYDYINYHGQLQSAQKYFTTYGWGKYMDALTASNNLVALEKRRLVVVATVVDKPVIEKEGVTSSGIHSWRIHMSVLVTYWLPPYNVTSKFSNPIDVSVIVQRQPILQSYKGLGVVQLIGSIATAPSGGASQAPISGTPTS